MKRYVIHLAMVACLVGTLAFAADPLGAPKAGLEQGQVGVSVEYSYTEMDLVRTHDTFGTIIEGDYDIDSMHTSYLTLSYGLTDWLEVFARVGAIDLDSSDALTWGPLSTFDNDLDTDFIYGAGVRVTFGCFAGVTFGAVGTYSYTQLEGDFVLEPPFSFVGDVDFRMEQIQVAVGGTWDATESISLYAGVLMHHVRAHHGRTTSFGMSSEHLAENDSTASSLGGYLGGKVGLTENVYLAIEGSYTGDSEGGSAMLGWNF